MDLLSCHVSSISSESHHCGSVFLASYPGAPMTWTKINWCFTSSNILSFAGGQSDNTLTTWAPGNYAQSKGEEKATDRAVGVWAGSIIWLVCHWEQDEEYEFLWDSVWYVLLPPSVCCHNSWGNDIIDWLWTWCRIGFQWQDTWGNQLVLNRTFWPWQSGPPAKWKALERYVPCSKRVPMSWALLIWNCEMIWSMNTVWKSAMVHAERSHSIVTLIWKWVGPPSEICHFVCN